MSDKMQDAINARVEVFAREISEIIQQSVTDAVAQALQATGGSAPARTTRRKATRRKATRAKAASRKKATAKKAAGKATGSRRKKGQKRTPEQLEAMTKSLLKEIKRKGGRRIEEIGTALSIPTKELALPIKKLIADKKIKTTGQRRATRYSAK